MGCPVMPYIFFVIGAIAVYALVKFRKHYSETKKLERWCSTPKDVVILHGFPPAKTIPNASPYILKVETYLRMANISYQLDTKDSFGPKGKAPWITLNGQHITDSEFIIEFLNKKFEKNLNKNYTENELAIATTIRIMLDEHFIWGLALDRMIFNSSQLHKVMDIPLPLRYYFKYLIRKRSKSQGTGLHSETEIVHLMSKDLRLVSKILGNKKFICGNEPCELDSGIFAHLSQCVWALPESPYEKLVNGELKNLKEYCIRMKELFWKDWDKCLFKKE